MIRWTIIKKLFRGFKWRIKWCPSWGNCWWHWLEWLFMAMGMKPLLNILMNSSPMILISRLSHFCACFVTLERNYLRNHGFCLNLNPIMHSSNKSCKEVPIVWCNETYGQNCRCEAITKEVASSHGQLLKNNKNHHLLTFLSLLTTLEVFKEVQFESLVIGHTYENIDGSFGYLSKKLREQNNYVMEDLMKTFIFPKIIHSFCNSFKKSLITNLWSMDIWMMARTSLSVIQRCICFGFLWMR